MPATEKIWRNLRLVHVIFASSAIALFIATVWMLADDHNDEWREYQDTWDEIRAEHLEQKIQSEKQTTQQAWTELRKKRLEQEFPPELRPVYETENFTEAQKKLEEVQKALAGEEKIRKTRKAVAELERQVSLANREVKAQRAIRDAARADYGLAVTRNEPQRVLERLKDEYEREQEKVEELERGLEKKELALEDAEEKLNRLTRERDEAQAQIASLESELDRLESQKETVAPDSTFAAVKREVMQWPIIDAFNSPHEIKNDWLPDLDIKLGMAETDRYDNCRTCHLAIERVEQGNVPAFPHGDPESNSVQEWVGQNEFPHPFSTHPNPDLFVTAASPHPRSDFGCTICHQGQGWGTNFQNASHSPDTPHQEHKWAEEYGYHYNHFWEYPMFPERLEEASCVKCHHNISELGEHPEFGTTAPKLYRGFRLVKEYGCFGCHEIRGYSSGKPVGPDLRLEPNYAEAALAVLRDPALKQETAEEQSASPSLLNEQNISFAAIREEAKQLVDDPDSDEARRRLRTLLQRDKQLAEEASDADGQEQPAQPHLSSRTHGLADVLKKSDRPGKMRKVGPGLVHVAQKTTKDWMAYWVEEPRRFRPETRMPQFFHRTNQQDPHAQALMPVEIEAIAHYLRNSSQPVELDRPQAVTVDGEQKPYEPDVERGKKLFSERGCLACHQHEAFPKRQSDFGPDLSEVNEKIRPGEEGFRWLYTWLRDPQRHDPRTTMPNLYLDPYSTKQEGYIDPAADIAAFLLQGERPEYDPFALKPYLGVELDADFITAEAQDLGLQQPRGVRIASAMPRSPAERARVRLGNGESREQRLRENDVILSVEGKPVENPSQLNGMVQSAEVGTEVTLEVWHNRQKLPYLVTIDEPLNDLVRLHLSGALATPKVEETLKTRDYPAPRESITGDEIELVPEQEGAEVGPQEWRRMKLNYVGRRTISRYGCYGCHSIPGFESARPIGTALQDWGRKDTSKLAFGHIEEYLHEHGEPDGSSTHERVQEAMHAARADEFDSEEAEERGMRSAYFYEKLLHHRRAGFFWQKLRQPRSYDYHQVGTKGYDERLRMPKFPLDEEQIEAIATFVLGLVADPPAPQYVHRPGGTEGDRIRGEQLLRKYNCTGCHMLELPEIKYGADPELLLSSDLSGVPPEAMELLQKFQPVRDAKTGETLDSGEPVISFHGLVFQEPSPDAPPEFQEYSYDLWETIKVDDKLIVPPGPMLVPASKMVEKKPARGGDLAQWLIDRLVESGRAKDRREAWHMVPPPLYQEGRKVQTDWLYRFLQNPDQIRYTTVLRMPQFNMSPQEARSLANYFSAVDGSDYPYQEIPQQEANYVQAMNRKHGPSASDSDYLWESWKLLNANVCIGCHSVGGREVVIRDPEDLRGPDLKDVEERLRPEWTLLWLHRPNWLTPYTAMPDPFDPKSRKFPELFGGNPHVQTKAVRDALMNYRRLMERGTLVYESEQQQDQATAGGS